jgi:hypothetical protein
MKKVIGFLIWLALRVFVLLARRKSFTFKSPEGTPYMTRWPIWTRDRWPSADGKTGGEGFYLHRTVASDYERELHNHPAPGAALVLMGGYRETRCEGRGGPLHQHMNTRQIWRGPLAFHVLDVDTFHRVELDGRSGSVGGWFERPSWSLFYIGRRRGPWGFLGMNGEVRRADHHDGNTGETVKRYSAGSRRRCENPQRACGGEPTAGGTLCPACIRGLGKPVRP